MTETELTEREQRFESELIHASPTVLLLGAIGLVFYGAGNALRLVGQYSQVGALMAFVGTLLLVIAIVLHVEHLSFRIGRSAVVLIIGAAILNCVGSLMIAAKVSNQDVLWVAGASYLLGGVGVALVAVHKEIQMKATIADYAAGVPWKVRVTVHASFLSLIAGALGLAFWGFGDFGLTSDTGSGPWVLCSVGAVLVSIGVISHVEHLVPLIGRVAVGAAILAPLLWAAIPCLNAIDPADTRLIAYRVFLGIGALLAALACAIAFQKKITTDR